jgi:hypothetical protein
MSDLVDREVNRAAINAATRAGVSLPPQARPHEVCHLPLPFMQNPIGDACNSWRFELAAP